jgi:hypothetical protein
MITRFTKTRDRQVQRDITSCGDEINGLAIQHRPVGMML